MHDKSTWKEFFDAHAPIYEHNEFTQNTVQEKISLLSGCASAPLFPLSFPCFSGLPG